MVSAVGLGLEGRIMLEHVARLLSRFGRDEAALLLAVGLLLLALGLAMRKES